MIWTDKYSPNVLREVIGDKPQLIKLQDFILNYKKSRKKSTIIYGPTGSGKTCSIYAIAKENNLEILEVNSSDIRSKKGILNLFGDSLKQASLFNKGKVILFDDVDALSGTKDRGGAQAIASLIESSEFPIVLTTTDPWKSKLSILRKKSGLIEFKPPGYLEIFKILKNICNKEEIEISDTILKKIAVRSDGDVRSSINDLQTIAIGEKEIDIDKLDYREREESIFNLLQLIFKSQDINSINKSIDNVNLNFDEIFLWIEENLPNEYYNKELFESFERLSKADVFRGRIRRNQYWRFLIYQKLLMGVGVSLAKNSKKNEVVKYSRPQRILKLWRAKLKYSERKIKAEQISKEIHMSYKKVLSEVMPYCKNYI